MGASCSDVSELVETRNYLESKTLLETKKKYLEIREVSLMLSAKKA